MSTLPSHCYANDRLGVCTEGEEVAVDVCQTLLDASPWVSNASHVGAEALMLRALAGSSVCGALISLLHLAPRLLPNKSQRGSTDVERSDGESRMNSHRDRTTIGVCVCVDSLC